MAKDSRKVTSEEADRGEATTLETLIRQRARGLIDAIVEEELERRWEQRHRRASAWRAKATGMGPASGHYDESGPTTSRCRALD